MVALDRPPGTAAARRLTVGALAGLATGAVWATAVGGAVARPFWLLAALTIASSLAAVAASVRARSAKLLAASATVFLLAVYGTYVAVLAWALSDFTF